jgi:NAD(P)-dependent dehydrogenase (short-subunit alcohol dehydrogenase family)
VDASPSIACAARAVNEACVTFEGSFAREGCRLAIAEIDAERMADTAAEHWGIHWPPVRDMEWSFWKRVIDTNVGGVFLCTKHALRHMRTTGTGHVLNIWGVCNDDDFPAHSDSSPARTSSARRRHVSDIMSVCTRS